MPAMADNGDLYVHPDTGPVGTTRWGARYLARNGCGGRRDIDRPRSTMDGMARRRVRHPVTRSCT
jgi:hypothetical protein